MAGTVVEKAVCDSCGVAVREASSFCYNCGVTVSAGQGSSPVNTESQIVANNGRAFEQPSAIILDAPKIAENPTEEAKPAVVESTVVDNTKLRSAASLRRNVKAYNRKPVEIVWAERESSPKAFIIVSILLVVFTAVLLALALYLK